MNTAEKRVFALGFFDGVHLGHQALLRESTALAARLEAQAAAITFDAHPMSLFLPSTPPLITGVPDRKLLLQQYGMEAIYQYGVTEDVMSTSWQDFLEELMGYGAAGFVCGDDFHFGHRGQGDSRKLTEFCRQRGLPCIIVPEQTMDGVRISSTYIRRQLESGDMATAVRFLGHPHVFTGQVVHGQQLGRRLGIPTANLRLPTGLVVLKFGVYVCRCNLDGVFYPAVTNIGTRPTVGGEGVTVEAWLLDYQGELYGRTLTLEFYRFLRPEQKFPNLEALQHAVSRDARQTRAFFQARGQ